MRPALFLLVTSALQGQVSFVPGLPGDVYCPLPVSPCRNGATCLYSDPSVTASGSPTGTLLYGFGGFPFTCTVPVSVDTVDVVLGFYEPNKTAPGQRVFNVSTNGGGALPVDIFALAGLKKYTTVKIPSVQTADGVVRISFTAVVGNAVVSTIALNVAPPPVEPGPVEINEKHVTIKPVTGQMAVTIPDQTYVQESLYVIVNGLTMTVEEDYTVTGTAITLIRPSVAGDIVQLAYRY